MQFLAVMWAHICLRRLQEQRESNVVVMRALRTSSRAQRAERKSPSLPPRDPIRGFAGKSPERQRVYALRAPTT